MAFKPKKKQPDFSSLQTTLANAQISVKQNALYQTINQLIERLKKFQGLTVEGIEEVNNSVNETNVTVNEFITNTEDASFLTVDDEILNFPSSIRLLAGTNITFDDSVAGARTINASGSAAPSGYWTLLSDGDTVEAELIFANGEAIALFVPL